MMELDISKADVLLSSDEVEGVLITGHVLRSRIREIISHFYAKARPVRPSETEILNDYLLSNDNFISLRNKIADLKDRMYEIKQGSTAYRRLQRQLDELSSNRLSLISNIAASDDFLKYRSESKSAYNSALDTFRIEEDLILKLSPFLGSPSLPNIRVKGLTPQFIYDKLSVNEKHIPVKGQMVLMGSEDIHLRPQFAPVSIMNRGINKALLYPYGLINVPFEITNSYAVEAMGAGAFQRGKKICFSVNNGIPNSNIAWSDIDKYLPFACRSLSVPLMPLIEPFGSNFSFAEVFHKDAWDQISDEILDKHASTCIVCGDTNKTKVHADWKFNEPVKGSFSPGLQTLNGFIVLCSNCSDVLRPTLESILYKTNEGYILSVDDKRRSWLRTINRWDDSRSMDYPRDAYLLALKAHRRRAGLSWIVDLSYEKSFYLVLNDNIKVGMSGWIKWDRGSTFKITGSAFYENTSRNFFPKPSVFEVPWGTSLEDVSEVMKESNLAIVDKKGSGSHEYNENNLDNKNLSSELSDDMNEEIDELENSKPEAIDVNVDEKPTAQQRKLYDDDDDYNYDEDDKPSNLDPDYKYESFDKEKSESSEEDDDDIGFDKK